MATRPRLSAPYSKYNAITVESVHTQVAGLLIIINGFLREHLTSGDLYLAPMSSGLGKVGEGSHAQSMLKFPIEKDNICELGELAKSADGSAFNK